MFKITLEIVTLENRGKAAVTSKNPPVPPINHIVKQQFLGSYGMVFWRKEGLGDGLSLPHHLLAKDVMTYDAVEHTIRARWLKMFKITLEIVTLENRGKAAVTSKNPPVPPINHIVKQQFLGSYGMVFWRTEGLGDGSGCEGSSHHSQHREIGIASYVYY